MSGRKTRRPGEIALAPGSGIDKARSCSCWPKPDDARPCTPQTCDWRCRACRLYGRPFYSRDDLQYLEHGTGPLAAELGRLWRAKRAMKGRSAGEGGGDEADGWDLSLSFGEPHPQLVQEATGVYRLNPGDRVEPGGGLPGPRPEVLMAGDRPMLPHEIHQKRRRDRATPRST